MSISLQEDGAQQHKRERSFSSEDSLSSPAPSLNKVLDYNIEGYYSTRSGDEQPFHRKARPTRRKMHFTQTMAKMVSQKSLSRQRFDLTSSRKTILIVNGMHGYGNVIPHNGMANNIQGSSFHNRVVSPRRIMIAAQSMPISRYVAETLSHDCMLGPPDQFIGFPHDNETLRKEAPSISRNGVSVDIERIGQAIQQKKSITEYDDKSMLVFQSRALESEHKPHEAVVGLGGHPFQLEVLDMFKDECLKEALGHPFQLELLDGSRDGNVEPEKLSADGVNLAAKSCPVDVSWDQATALFKDIFPTPMPENKYLNQRSMLCMDTSLESVEPFMPREFPADSETLEGSEMTSKRDLATKRITSISEPTNPLGCSDQHHSAQPYHCSHTSYSTFEQPACCVRCTPQGTTCLSSSARFLHCQLAMPQANASFHLQSSTSSNQTHLPAISATSLHMSSSSDKVHLAFKEHFMRKFYPPLPHTDAAPYVVCQHCLMLLEIPSGLSLKHYKVQKLRCSSCSKVSKFSLAYHKGASILPQISACHGKPLNMPSLGSDDHAYEIMGNSRVNEASRICARMLDKQFPQASMHREEELDFQGCISCIDGASETSPMDEAAITRLDTWLAKLCIEENGMNANGSGQKPKSIRKYDNRINQSHENPFREGNKSTASQSLRPKQSEGTNVNTIKNVEKLKPRKTCVRRSLMTTNSASEAQSWKDRKTQELSIGSKSHKERRHEGSKSMELNTLEKTFEEGKSLASERRMLGKTKPVSTPASGAPLIEHFAHDSGGMGLQWGKTSVMVPSNLKSYTVKYVEEKKGSKSLAVKLVNRSYSQPLRK